MVPEKVQDRDADPILSATLTTGVGLQLCLSSSNSIVDFVFGGEQVHKMNSILKEIKASVSNANSFFPPFVILFCFI